MDDPSTFIAAVVAAIGLIMFLVGLVMFVWGVATLGDKRTAGLEADDSSFWEMVKEILKKCLRVAFDGNRPLAERRLALGFLMMLVSCGLLLTALGIVAGQALTSDGGDGGSTDTAPATT
jgi:sulfite exporter TauE/SafE